jgi:hypothetical protein
MASKHLLESIPYSKVSVLRVNIKLILHKALIRSVIPHACPTWELAEDTYPLKLLCLQNKVLCITGNFPKCTWFSTSTYMQLYNKIV